MVDSDKTFVLDRHQLYFKYLIISVGGMEPMAISLTDAYKSYGRGKKKVEVLRNLKMNVRKGSIYGLLGELCLFIYHS